MCVFEHHFMRQNMRRKILIAVGVALLVAVAGCNTSADVNPTPTDDPATEQTMDWHNATASAVGEAGSYTLHVNSSSDTSGPDGENVVVTNETSRVDLASDLGVRTTGQTFSRAGQRRTSTTTVYTENKTSYRQLNASQGVSYSRQTGSAEGYGAIQPVNVSGYSGNFSVIAESFEWAKRGTATIDDTETVRYTSTNLTDSSALLEREDVTVSNASATSYVSDDGVVRRLSLEYTLQQNDTTTQFELTHRLSDIGSTAVEEPEWIAKAQTTGTPP